MLPTQLFILWFKLGRLEAKTASTIWSFQYHDVMHAGPIYFVH